MKVLIKREAFEEWSMEVNCTGREWENKEVPCGSSLEIDKNDIYVREFNRYPDEKGKDLGFVCPVCGCFTALEKNKLPKNLEKVAKLW